MIPGTRYEYSLREIDLRDHYVLQCDFHDKLRYISKNATILFGGKKYVRRREVRRNNAERFCGQAALHEYLVDTVDRRWVLPHSSINSTGFVQDAG